MCTKKKNSIQQHTEGLGLKDRHLLLEHELGQKAKSQMTRGSLCRIMDMIRSMKGLLGLAQWVEDSPSSWAPVTQWETQEKLLPHGFCLSQAWLLWPFGKWMEDFSLCLSLSLWLYLSNRQINTS